MHQARSVFHGKRFHFFQPWQKNYTLKSLVIYALDEIVLKSTDVSIHYLNHLRHGVIKGTLRFTGNQLIHVEPTREQIIDRFGELYWALERIKPEFDDLRGRINGWHADLAADKPALVHGRRYSVQLSARENRRRIFDKAKAFALLRKAIGLDALVELLTIPLKDGVDKHIAEDKHRLFLIKERTGPRDLVAIPREPQAQPQTEQKAA